MLLVLDANSPFAVEVRRGRRSCCPRLAFEEAARRLPEVFAVRKLPPEPFLEYFQSLSGAVRIVDSAEYLPMEGVARRLMAKRDSAAA